MSWPYEDADPLIISVSRDQVERGDIREVLATLNELVTTPDRTRRFKERVAIGFGGYDDDTEPLYEKPDVRRFVMELDQEFPFWLYFLSRYFDSLPLISLCMLLPHLTEEARREMHPKQLQDWIENRWGPALNYVCQTAGLPERVADELLESGINCLVNGPTRLPT